MYMRYLKVTRGGQVSIPADIRRRWSTSRVALEDQGDHLTLAPAASDPIAAARGALAGESTAPSAELRKAAREAEQIAEERRTRAR